MELTKIVSHGRRRRRGWEWVMGSGGRGVVNF